VHTKGTRTRNAVLRLALVAGLTLAAGLTALTAARPAVADEPNALTGTLMQSGFYPCPDQQDFNRGPLPSECTDTAPRVDASGTSCNPAGDSTIKIVRTGAFGSPSFGNGAFTETITAKIGPQTGPVVPDFQPTFTSGYRASSQGFRSGALLEFTSTVHADLADGTTIDVTKTLSPGNTANTGVCRTFDGTTPVGEHAFYPPSLLLDGYFYLVNAQVLTYSGTVSDAAGTSEINGIAQTYLGDTYATANSGTDVTSASGTLLTEFGTVNETVREFRTPTATGTNVAVTPAPAVTLTFPSVTVAGDTTVTSILDIDTVQPPPANFSVGEPPMLYDIHTDATFSGDVKVCVPYGPLGPGETPSLWHYDSTTSRWKNITVQPVDTLNKIVCGLTSSFSPFAVFISSGPSYALTGPFHPVDAFPTPNAMQAGQTVPVKFSLGGDYGLDVFESDYPKSVASTCGTTAPDPVESTSANSSGLVYDATTGVYTYHWKTNKLWKACRTLTVLFRDGSSFQANFKFK